MKLVKVILICFIILVTIVLICLLFNMYFELMIFLSGKVKWLKYLSPVPPGLILLTIIGVFIYRTM